MAPHSTGDGIDPNAMEAKRALDHGAIKGGFGDGRTGGTLL